MSILEAFRLAFQSLWGNKMRSVLTLIGVVMGVASVIMVLTLVQGAKRYISTKLSGYGADVFTVNRMSSVILSAEQYFSFQKRKILRMEDYEAIKDGCTDCDEVGASLNKSTNVVYNGHSSNNTGVRGLTSSMMSLNNIDIALGRGFTPADEEHAFHNCIVGYDIVDNLIGDGDPIGKEIRVDGIPFTIIGVGDRQGKTLGQSQDNWVAIPISVYQQIYGYNDSVNIYARASGGAQVMTLAEDQARVIMRTRRHLAPGQPDDFEIQTNDTFLDIANQLLGVFAWVVLGLGSIALVVGGVVIMNIMLVSVTERTREIGVRKALGAKQRDVLMQFLIESASLAGIGGVFGILMGVLVGKLITVFVGFPTAVPLWAVFLGLFLASGVGIFFGVYPASKAARLDPVVALRAEM
ncbi:MAG TPA: ABC transporter permease [Terracidiphilus sp.]|jgi:putative ABC transport system permease protein|nr:ABC transporter permease [Terracidiphilus sp.]